MKKRKWLLGSSLLLVVLLVAGGTMAWFTAQADPVVNNFKAGTLKLGITEEFKAELAQNVNPGDTYNKQVVFCNDGTKRMFVRAKFEMTEGWEEVALPNIYKHFVKGEDGWYYYRVELKPGECITFMEAIKFAGAEMGNEFQGQEFNLTIKGEAIQVTNGAALAEWGVYPPSIGN